MVLRKKDKIKMRKKIKAMINGKPVLPGTIGEYYNVCGKSPCRCKNKVNPQKHGPYYQLSYNLKGKNSSIAIKSSDVNIIREITDNYRSQISNIQDLGLELLEVYKNEGCQAMIDKYETLFYKELSKKMEIQPKPRNVKELTLSRDNWKAKAIKRQKELVTKDVKIINLSDSRENWKKKYHQEKTENKIIKQEITTLNKELKEQKAQASEQSKKNS
jgi:hypothetical protein